MTLYSGLLLATCVGLLACSPTEPLDTSDPIQGIWVHDDGLSFEERTQIHGIHANGYGSLGNVAIDFDSGILVTLPPTSRYEVDVLWRRLDVSGWYSSYRYQREGDKLALTALPSTRGCENCPSMIRYRLAQPGEQLVEPGAIESQLQISKSRETSELDWLRGATVSHLRIANAVPCTVNPTSAETRNATRLNLELEQGLRLSVFVAGFVPGASIRLEDDTESVVELLGGAGHGLFGASPALADQHPDIRTVRGSLEVESYDESIGYATGAFEVFVEPSAQNPDGATVTLRCERFRVAIVPIQPVYGKPEREL